MTTQTLAKPLAWRTPKDDGQDFGHEDMAFIADGIGGLYCIEAGGLLWWAHDPFQWAQYSSIDAAKAAAEEDWQRRYGALIATPPAVEPWSPTHRHLKRGSTYRVIGTAMLQASTGPVGEAAALVIYKDEKGRLWARAETEFDDGRFERIAT